MPPRRSGTLAAGSAQDELQDEILAELQLLKSQVAGIHGCLAATSDGLVVASDIPDTEPSQIAALAAASLAVATRATLTTGRGVFREALTRGDGGYLAIYAAGSSVILAVIGTSSLNVGMLQYRVREVVHRIAECSAQMEIRTPPQRAPRAAARPAAPAQSAAPARGRDRTQARDAASGGLPPRLPKRRPGS